MGDSVDCREDPLNNRYRITLASFLAYFLMSGMLAPIGIISAPMAEALDIPLTRATAGFSWLTIGILVGALAAMFVFDWLSVRRLMLVLYATIGIALAVLRLSADAVLIWPALGVIGVACGIGLAAAALTISRSYDDSTRASMLVITDGAFSVAGIVCAWLAVTAIGRGWHWATSYLALAAIAVGILLLSLPSRYPARETAQADASPTRWPAAVWLLAGALFLYTLAQNTMLWWLPNFLTIERGVAADRAGQVVGQFWTGMFAAQVTVALIVLRTGARRLLLLAGLTTLLFSLPMWLVRDFDLLLVLALAWGFANLGLLKIVLSFATEQVAVPPPRLVSLMLLGATLGTAISPMLSSRIVAVSDTLRVLQFGSACYLTMWACLLIANLLRVRIAPND